ncbi:enoyl-CoA hydratase/isomerase family protein [Alicyclobacillus fastidiosus]|uniref:Enoyl-CoA hydratase-related protein n=1 Tax=Alicyclobacillus fastidiosus TaxID=392011 RepID=A0ABV5AFM2_9BACL|nr:enoyl-CoA hydratase-related protein [Alicyclobacillus fastidiosus]WEH09628.1 enoyl-CoA hydratase-related protein [Alicyclobacillus fastidiosus]
MAEESFVQLRVEDQTAILSLNRPKQLNALNRNVLSELGMQIAMLSGRKDIRTVILRGEGKAFAAGADIAEMQELSAQQAEQFARMGQRVFTALESLAQPTIALVHGFALGGGMELSMACDVRIAAEGTQFGQPEVQLGVVPGFGGSQRLPRIVGAGRAMHLLLSGERIDAQTALAYGLVTEVVPGAELLDAGLRYASVLHKLGPVALQYVKRAVYDGAELDLARGQALEANLFGLTFATKDQREGMRAFLEKRAAQFRGE